MTISLLWLPWHSLVPARAGASCCKSKVAVSDRLTLRRLRSLPASWPPTSPTAAILLTRRTPEEGGGQCPWRRPCGFFRARSLLPARGSRCLYPLQLGGRGHSLRKRPWGAFPPFSFGFLFLGGKPMDLIHCTCFFSWSRGRIVPARCNGPWPIV